MKSIAVVGTGYWGKNLVRNFHALGGLHTVCDTHPDTLAQFLSQYPGTHGASAYTEVLGNPEIKAVVLATPAQTHGQMIREALLADKDVYAEKPLCLSETEGAALNQLAAERGRILMVGHLLWYHPMVLKLKELIATGALGRIRYIYSNRLNMGKLRREENVLWSFAPHDISVTLGLLDEMPETVQAQGGNFLHHNIADTTVTLLSFASGVRAHIFVSWLHPFKEQKLVVVGEDKMAVFDDTAPWEDKLQLYPHTVEWSDNVPVANKAEMERVSVPQDEPLRNECAHFMEAVQQRSTPRTDGEEGLRVLKVLNACQTALEQGQPVRIDPDHAADDYCVHPSAAIDEGVQIGNGTKIWHFSHVLGDSRIGPHCNIGQNVVIGPRASVGARCKIQNNVSVYEGVTLEDDVFCGPSMVFTNVVNPRAHIARKAEYKPTLVRKGATIGANATVVCGNTLGRFCLIGAGAVITQDVPDHALMVGNPARRIGWVCDCAERLDEQLTCPVCGHQFQQTNLGLTPQP